MGPHMLGQVQSLVVAALCQVGEGAGGVGSQLQLGARHNSLSRLMFGCPGGLGGCRCAVYCSCLQGPARRLAVGAASGRASKALGEPLAVVVSFSKASCSWCSQWKGIECPSKATGCHCQGGRVQEASYGGAEPQRQRHSAW